MRAVSGQLLWRCRRGMKELDLLLERFARARLPLADAQQHRRFEALLELPDPVLAAYLLGGEAPEPELGSLVAQIRTYVA